MNSLKVSFDLSLTIIVLFVLSQFGIQITFLKFCIVWLFVVAFNMTQNKGE